MLLVAIHNVQFVDKATRAIMGRWHCVHAAVWDAVAGMGRLCGRPAAGSTTMLGVVGAAVLFDSIKMLKIGVAVVLMQHNYLLRKVLTGPYWVPLI